MNKAKTRCTSDFLILIIILIISFAIFDIWLIHTEYENYQEKVNILCKMVASNYVINSDETSNDETSKGVTSKDEIRNDKTSNDKISNDEITQDKISKDNISSDETSNEVTRKDVTNDDITANDITSNDVIRSATEILKGNAELKSGNNGKELLEAYGYTLDKNNALYDMFLSQSLRIVVVSVICCLLGFAVISSIHIKKQKKVNEQIQLLEQILSDYRNEQYDASSQLKYEFTEDEIEKLKDEIVAFGDYLKLLNEKITYEKEETKSLVTDISHQLKTPVAALKTSFEILQQQDLKPNEKIEFMERCNLQISGIENLLSALLNISRMETGLIEIKRENLILFETLLEAVNRVYLKAEEKYIHIEMDAEELQELYIPHDRKWICEAVINLLDNAIKYSPSDTTITIRLMKRTTFLRLEIEDEGIGIPKSEYNRVFQRFYRGNAEEVKRQPGSGVGLYLTREIISRHNGTIRVQTREPKPGSVFIIQLPYSV